MSRRDQIRMTDSEIRRFVESSKTMILVSNGPEGFPHPMPMWFFRMPDGAIRMTTYRSSQKVQNLRRDPRVALLVESGTEYAQLKGVLFYGRAELIEDVDTILDTLLAASGAEDSQATRRAMTKTAEKRVLISVKPEKIVSWDHAKLSGVY